MNSKKPWIVHVSTYKPYQDGIATFTEHILKSQQIIFDDRLIHKVAAIEILKEKGEKYPTEVEWVIKRDEKTDYKNLARQINKNKNIEVIFLQHEYGIFGGNWGSYIIDFLKNVKKPVITVLHTVLPNPEDDVQKITQSVIDLSSSIIVLTDHSQENLLTRYSVRKSKVEVIPHGIHPIIFRSPEEAKGKSELEDKIILGTFGFLGPSKGIEYVLQALPEVFKKYPQTTYWLMGRTHPLVKKQYGESYREFLHKLTEKLGISKNVKFRNKFMTVDEELDFLSTVDIYISTSLNPDQAVSGTLSYALGTGRCVVSTNFIQAREVIKKDMGILVDFRYPDSYTRAIIQLLKRPKLRSKMHWTAFVNTRHMLFPNVSLSYISCASKRNPTLGKEEILLPQIKLDHLFKMTDKLGLIQFAKGTTPDLPSGYTLDDNARALIVCVKLLDIEEDEEILTLADKYLEFIKTCQTESGDFINYIGENKKQDKLRNSRENLEDARARALWALSEVLTNKLPEKLKIKAYKIWKRAKTSRIKFTHLRSRAFYIKTLSRLYQSDFFESKQTILAKRIAKHADYLCYVYNKHSAQGHAWKWFENKMTYSNALLPEALLLAFDVVEKEIYYRTGIESLEFLISSSFRDSLYLPIGNAWYEQEKNRPYFDQQPEEVMAMTYALVEAFEITGDNSYKKMAMRSLFWFLGNNILGVPIYNKASGGTKDGLSKEGININEGAESTISYLLARLKISTLFKKGKRYNRVTSF